VLGTSCDVGRLLRTVLLFRRFFWALLLAPFFTSGQTLHYVALLALRCEAGTPLRVKARSAAPQGPCLGALSVSFCSFEHFTGFFCRFQLSICRVFFVLPLTPPRMLVPLPWPVLSACWPMYFAPCRLYGSSVAGLVSCVVVILCVGLRCWVRGQRWLFPVFCQLC